MELTHTLYKNKVASTPVIPSFRRELLNFINQHAEVFEALARSATPFGGSCRPLSRGASGTRPGRPADQLPRLSDSQSGAVDQVAVTNEIGINRFRMLQTES